MSQTALVGATAMAGPTLEPIHDAVVVLDGERISALGPRSSVDVPSQAEVVAVDGHTVVPGFIDAHVHIGFYEPHALVTGGVTTARDLAWPPDAIHPLATASRSPDFEGPQVFAAGPMLTVPRGYPTRAGWAPPGTGRTVESPAEVASVVALTADEGACCIKVALNPAVGPVLDRETLVLIVGEAHARGLKVTGHVHGLAELEKALDAGMDELAHILMSTERIPDEILQRMASAMTVVPTLSIRYLRDKTLAIENTARFLAAGGRVVYGTDLGNSGPRPGIDARETKAMAAAGMDARSILYSATVGSADWLDLGDRGVLEPGRLADVVVLRSDELDVGALTAVEMVWRSGKRRR